MKIDKILLRAVMVLAAVAVTVAMVRGGGGTVATMGKLTSTEPVRLAVLMYHSVNSNPGKSSEFVITPEALRCDLEYLRESGYNTIVMSQLIDFVHNGTPLPPKPVMLTFDDGYYNNYLNAYPLLKEYNAKAVISIIGIETDRYSELSENNQNYSHLTWEQIKEMQQSGLIEFQNHGYNMHRSGNPRLGATRLSGESVEQYQQKLTEDIQKLQDRYAEMTGYTPTTYTYPFGRISRESYPVITELGSAASLDVQARLLVATPGEERCLFRIPRYNRTCCVSARSILERAFAAKAT